MDEKQGLPIIPFATQQAREDWLDEHHLTSKGVWIKMAKVKSGVATVTQGEAVESALCFGWIDGQSGSFDETYWLQRFTPRGPRSVWSKINKAKAVELIESGRMRPAGLAAVERARGDGHWERAYDPPSTASVPADLQQALDDHPAAAAFFATLDRQNRYAILHRIQEARKPETRARRIAKYVDMLARHEKSYP